MTEPLEVSKLCHFALGFANGHGIGQRFGNSFAVDLESETQVRPVDRLARLMAATTRLSATAGSATDRARAKIAKLRDLPGDGGAAAFQFGKGIQHRGSLLYLAYIIRTDRCHKKRNPASLNFRVAHPLSLHSPYRVVISSYPLVLAT
jgi:hypothetical protein